MRKFQLVVLLICIVCIVEIVAFGWFRKSEREWVREEIAKANFAVDVEEIQVAIENAPFTGSVSFHINQKFLDNHLRGPQTFLLQLLRSKLFLAEIAKRDDQESFVTLRGWKVPLKQEFDRDGNLGYERGLLFRIEGDSPKTFPNYFFYDAEKLSSKWQIRVFWWDEEPLGWRPTVEEIKKAIIGALQKGN